MAGITWERSQLIRERGSSSCSLTNEVRECERVRTQLTLSGGRAGGEGFNTLSYVIRTTNGESQVVRLELHIEHSLESLILAQDERWRRA